MQRAILILLAAACGHAAVKFRPQEIQADFGVVYAVTTADMNEDGKPDIVAINPTQAVWFENPSWTKHVIAAGVTKKDNVCMALDDIDRDGHLDIALGADWQPTNTAGGGSLQWLRNPAKAGAPWPLTALPEEPTLHRMRWGDVDGDGRNELIVVPLHGRGNVAPAWEGAGARILVYWPGDKPSSGAWKMEVADSSLHIVHNFIVVDGEIWTASREGVHALKRAADGSWSKRTLGAGAPGEIKLGSVNRIRHLATVEPWHGNKIVVYEEPTAAPDPQAVTKIAPPVIAGAEWKRTEIETGLAQAHALGWGDFDGNGSDDLAVGWRGKPWGVAWYGRGADGTWTRHAIDDGVAAEDLVVDDLNGDGRPEIVAVGRATANVRIYWNESSPEWVRHEVGSGFATATAVAADFTGDGLPDIVANDGPGKRTVLFVQPARKGDAWKQVVLHEGANAIHSEAMDVDGDGDIDYIGARYSPGLIFWLEQPTHGATEKWTYHVVDDFAKGGVNGIHGLITGDVDRDGKLDLIGNSAQSDGAFPNSLAWFRIPRDVRRAQRWERYIFADKDAPGLSHYLGFGDVNGDGRPDMASGAKIADGGNWFAWWEQGADPRRPFTKHVIATGQPGATNIHIADINRDGKADFFASRGHGRGVVWYEAPDWRAHEVDGRIVGPHSLAMGDIDGDGDIDAATCAKDSATAAWYENDGRGGFTVHHIWENQAAYDIRLIDMDRDGDLDVVVAGQESRNVVWFENRIRTDR